MKSLQGFFCTFLTALFVVYGTAGAIASENPIIKMDANGNAIAVWDTVQNSSLLIQANTFVGSTWGTPQTIVSDATAFGQKLAMRADGTDVQAVVVWTAISNGVNCLFGSMLPSSTDDWTAIAQISGASEDVQNPQYDVVINDNGDVIVTWASLDGSYNEYIRASTSTVGFANSWSTPETISGP